MLIVNGLRIGGAGVDVIPRPRLCLQDRWNHGYSRSLIHTWLPHSSGRSAPECMSALPRLRRHVTTVARSAWLEWWEACYGSESARTAWDDREAGTEWRTIARTAGDNWNCSYRSPSARSAGDIGWESCSW